jgi:hypothetical protein
MLGWSIEDETFSEQTIEVSRECLQRLSQSFKPEGWAAISSNSRCISRYRAATQKAIIFHRFELE